MRRLTIISMLTAALLALTASPVHAADRHPLPDVRPAWAAAGGGTAAPADGEVSFHVYLRSRDPAGLAASARAVSDPSSPRYGRYLGASDVQRRFGPRQSERDAVTGWLRGEGLSVDGTDGDAVAAHGTIGQAGAAFGTGFDEYRHGGASMTLPTGALSVPADLGDVVTTVTGLGADDVAPAPAAAPASGGGGDECSTYVGQDPATSLPPAYGRTVPWGVCGYTPAQMRGAYGVSGTGLDGSGVTVAIIDIGAAPDMEQAADRYAESVGDPPFAPGQYREDLSVCQADSSCAPIAGNTEESLDVEALHGMAPGADIVFVPFEPRNGGGLDAIAHVVDDHLADMISWSGGMATLDPAVSDATVTAYEQVLEEAAAEGIGLYESSGDSGDASNWHIAGWDGTPHVLFPSSDPWVTAVGGTTLAVGPGNAYAGETSWGNQVTTLTADGTAWADPPGKFAGGGGGGVSVRFPQPWYQAAAVPASLSRSRGGGPTRVVPDIAADADRSFLVGRYDSGSWVMQPVGGTSLAAPLIAGMQADLQQRLGVPIGFANPLIYARYGTAAYHDIGRSSGTGTPVDYARVETSGTSGQPADDLVTVGMDSSLATAPGYDDATGVGSPGPGFFGPARHG